MFRKILIMNDLHIPKSLDESLDIINKHKNEITHIVFGGDLLDLSSVSTFTKFSYVSLLEEVKKGYEFLTEVRNILPNKVKIILLQGNHENRLVHYINKLNDREVVPFVNPYIMEWFRDGFQTYEYGKTIKYDAIDNVITTRDWHAVLDNRLAITHPWSWTKNQYNFSKTILQWFFNNDFEPEMVVLGHTHKIGYMRISEYKNTPVVSSGCLSKPAKYGKGKVSMLNEQKGYLIVSYDTLDKTPLGIANVEQFDLGINYKEISHLDI